MLASTSRVSSEKFDKKTNKLSYVLKYYTHGHTIYVTSSGIYREQ